MKFLENCIFWTRWHIGFWNLGKVLVKESFFFSTIEQLSENKLLKNSFS